MRSQLLCGAIYQLHLAMHVISRMAESSMTCIMPLDTQAIVIQAARKCDGKIPRCFGARIFASFRRDV